MTVEPLELRVDLQRLILAKVRELNALVDHARLQGFLVEVEILGHNIPEYSPHISVVIHP